MTPFVSKLIWVALALCWGAIRYRFGRRAMRNRPVAERDRRYEIVLLGLAFVGYVGVPVLYLVTPWLSLGDYPFQPILAWLGLVAAGAALWLFWRSHADLGRNFSIKLVIREHHDLVTSGVYQTIRHPMYASFLLWSLGQALLLPNWVTGLAALAAFCVIYFARIGREEELMLETFGDDYRRYMLRTKRLLPYIH